MSYKPQPEDYFTLTGIGFTASGTVAPEGTTHVTATDPSYVNYFNGSKIDITYTFMYWNQVAYPNPITGGIAYIGATPVNGLSIVVDTMSLTNETTTKAYVDILKASPANIKTAGINIIPPSLIKRVEVPAESTLLLDSRDMNINLKNLYAQTVTTPYYMTGDGLALAFPNGLTTTGTTTTTTTRTLGVYNVSVEAQCHWEH